MNLCAFLRGGLINSVCLVYFITGFLDFKFDGFIFLACVVLLLSLKGDFEWVNFSILCYNFNDLIISYSHFIIYLFSLSGTFTFDSIPEDLGCDLFICPRYEVGAFGFYSIPENLGYALFIG